MKPIRTKHTNSVFKLPGGTEENDLPVELTTDSNGRNVIVSTWQLSDTELDALIENKKIDLLVWGAGHPPVALAIHDEEEGEEDGHSIDG